MADIHGAHPLSSPAEMQEKEYGKVAVAEVGSLGILTP